MKLFLYPEHILVLWAAKKVGRPVKWAPDRADAFMTDTQGRDNVTRLGLALDAELRFLALEVGLVANMGAYLSNFAPEIPTASGGGDAQRRLCDPGGPCRRQGRVHSSRAGRCISRRGSAGGCLCDRTPGRLCRPPAWRTAARAAPAQFHQARGNALPDRARPQL